LKSPLIEPCSGEGPCQFLGCRFDDIQSSKDILDVCHSVISVRPRYREDESMPRQNRVTPFGHFEAHSARGQFMGNRGILHTDKGELGPARWKHKNWIVCATSFKGRQRTITSPGCYTELFFCDEPTALAAGHRPCSECRNADYRRFAEAWRSAHALPGRLKAAEMDHALHQTRLRGREQASTTAFLGDLPDGVVVVLREHPAVARLVWDGHLHQWTHFGYAERRPVVPELQVDVLTPEPTVNTLRAGYAPVVHPTART
jgi:hypothetical protein